MSVNITSCFNWPRDYPVSPMWSRDYDDCFSVSVYVHYVLIESCKRFVAFWLYCILSFVLRSSLHTLLYTRCFDIKLFSHSDVSTHFFRRLRVIWKEQGDLNHEGSGVWGGGVPSSRGCPLLIHSLAIEFFWILKQKMHVFMHFYYEKLYRGLLYTCSQKPEPGEGA